MLNKFKSIFSKNSILNKILLPYISVLVIPILVITIIMFQINFNMYKTEIAEKTGSGIENLRQIVDIEIDGLMTVTNMVFSDTSLADTWSRSMTDNMSLYQKKLTTYMGTNNFIKEIGVYVPEYNYVFSSESPSSLENYSGRIYKFGNFSPDEFKQFISTEEKILYIPVHARNIASYKHYACIIKESAVYSTNNRIAIITLDVDYINNLFDNVNGDSYIFDSEGNVIAASTTNHKVPGDVVWELTKTDNEKINYENEVYYIKAITSNSNNWQYVLLSEYDDVYKNLSYVQWIYTFIILAVIIAGILILMYTIKHVYSPIRSLASHLESSSEDFNEIEAIRNNVQSLVKTNEDLEKRVEDAYAIAKEHMFYKLINGEISDEAEAKRQFAFYDINFDFDYYYIALFDVEEYVHEVVSEAVKLLTDYTKEYNCFTMSVFENHKLCVICPALDKNHTSEDYALITNMRGFLEEITMSRITVGVGNPVADISTIWKSYIEAQSASDYKKIKGSGQILMFRDVSTLSDKAGYTDKDIQKLAIYIKAGEMNKTFEIIDEIVRSLHNVSLHVAQCVCFELIIVILNAVSDKVDGDLYFSKFDITTLVEFESINSLVDEVKKFLNEIFAEVENKHTETDRFIDRIVEYVNENYNKPFFSVDNITQHFGVSTTYLAQYFKMKKGMTVSGYITKVQIDNTKRILLSTDKTIKEIADEVGFTDVSNFIRKFKAQTGVTPGVYRKANKK